MNRFDFPVTLPSCDGLHPAFKKHFSGWQLGMGLPDTLSGLLHGLTLLGEDVPDCKPVAQGMALWGLQAYPLSLPLAHWCMKLTETGLPLTSAQAALADRLARVSPLGDDDVEAMETWHALARQDERSLIFRFLTMALGDPHKGLAWLGHCWQDLLFLGMPEVPKAALDMVAWDNPAQPVKLRMEAEWAFHCLPPVESLPFIEKLDPEFWGLWRAYAGSELLLRMDKKGEAKGALVNLWKAIPWHVNLTLKVHDLSLIHI